MTSKRRSALSTASTRRAGALLAALCLTGASACGDKPSAAECEKVVRHIIDLEAAEAGAGAAPTSQRTELEQRKKNVFQAVGTTYCRDEMSADQVRCALDAKNLAELSTKCDDS